MAVQEPPGLLGIHTNMAATVPADIAKALAAGAPAPAGLSPDEKRAYDQLDDFYKNGLGYAIEMNNRPQTLYGIVDSPVGLAAWMLDHDIRSYELIARVFDGKAEGLTQGRHPRQRHALLADQHGDLLGAALLGQCALPVGRLLRSARHQDPGRGQRLPGRDLPGAAELGREGLSEAHPLQPAPQGRPLRRLGAAGGIHRRAEGVVHAAAPGLIRPRGASRRRLPSNSRP